jgi:hypothetical protein
VAKPFNERVAINNICHRSTGLYLQPGRIHRPHLLPIPIHCNRTAELAYFDHAALTIPKHPEAGRALEFQGQKIQVLFHQNEHEYLLKDGEPQLKQVG